jgi:tetratricopeptide (TPR) repeat protein
VVRKGGGRNINNDRYIYINVDDAPNPFPELRRLLDINLGLLYQEKVGRLSGANDVKGARDAAAKVVRYQPQNMQAQMTLGMLDYAAGQKSAALDALRKAKTLDPENFRRRFDQMVQRPAYKSILDDKEFLKTLEN